MARLKHNMVRAQNRMKQVVDRKGTKLELEPGDWVFLKLQPYR